MRNNLVAAQLNRLPSASPALDRQHDSCQISRALLLEKREDLVRGILLAAVIASFTMGTALAQESCETKAVGKDGKALAGAAKTSFMKKCKADSCATKAMSSDGKPLSGAAKNSFMKKCETAA
jgi:hypothetical protein